MWDWGAVVKIRQLYLLVFGNYSNNKKRGSFIVYIVSKEQKYSTNYHYCDVNHIKSSKSRRIFGLCVYDVFLIQDKYLFFTKI